MGAKMLNKSGRIATLFFVVVMLLPLLAIVMMDYEVKKANDITGEQIFSDKEGGTIEQVYLGISFIAGFLSFAIVVLVIVGIRKYRKMSDKDLENINTDINKLDSEIKTL